MASLVDQSGVKASLVGQTNVKASSVGQTSVKAAGLNMVTQVWINYKEENYLFDI